jgi:hypothetical protein
MRLSKVHEEAANLLSALASQPDHVDWTPFGTPGRWSASATKMADAAWDKAANGHGWIELNWREAYAEAERLIRDGSIR